MKTLTKTLILAFFVIGLTNCGTTYFTLDPDEDSKLEMGRNVIEKEDDFALSALSFEDKTDKEFMFYLYVQNKNQETLLLDPKTIYVKVYDENKKQIDVPKIYAFDPEEQIYILNKNIQERETEHDVATGLNIVFSLFNTVADLTDNDNNDAEEVLENVVIFTGNHIGEKIDYENDIDYLKSQKSYWKNEVLRKTELEENEDIGGIFYMPINPNAKFLKIYIPLGKTVHTYKFQQIAS